MSWNGQAVWMYEAVMWFAVAYILLCTLDYGYHNIGQVWHGLWEKYERPCEPKSSKVWKNAEKIGLCSFNADAIL